MTSYVLTPFHQLLPHYPKSTKYRLGRRRLELTAKEFGCLEYLLRHKGEIVSQEALLEHVWDGSVNPFSATVRMHIASLRRKLGDPADAPQYIETVTGQGYRLGRESDYACEN